MIFQVNHKKEKRGNLNLLRIKKLIDLMKKENKIIKDFHGILDFYNLIRGIAIELKSGDSTNNENISKIIQNIEINFWGIDIDLQIVLEDIKYIIEFIKNILEDYENSEENKKF